VPLPGRQRDPRGRSALVELLGEVRKVPAATFQDHHVKLPLVDELERDRQARRARAGDAEVALDDRPRRPFVEIDDHPRPAPARACRAQ
jgi:hypothetical protein